VRTRDSGTHKGAYVYKDTHMCVYTYTDIHTHRCAAKRRLRAEAYIGVSNVLLMCCYRCCEDKGLLAEAAAQIDSHLLHALQRASLADEDQVQKKKKKKNKKRTYCTRLAR
jgi:hypothetical protein